MSDAKFFVRYQIPTSSHEYAERAHCPVDRVHPGGGRKAVHFKDPWKLYVQRGSRALKQACSIGTGLTTHLGQAHARGLHFAPRPAACASADEADPGPVSSAEKEQSKGREGGENGTPRRTHHPNACKMTATCLLLDTKSTVLGCNSQSGERHISN